MDNSDSFFLAPLLGALIVGVPFAMTYHNGLLILAGSFVGLMVHAVLMVILGFRSGMR